MSVEKLSWGQMPESLMGKIGGLLESSDLYNLSVTSKDNKQILELAEKDIFLTKDLSTKYLADNDYRKKINSVLDSRNTKLHLDLSDSSEFRTLPNLSTFNKLAGLNLSSNYKMYIPKNLEETLPKSLRILKLCDCFELREFPDLRKFTNLVELDLSDNDDISTPQNIAELLPRSLQILKLCQCQLLKFPDLSMLVNLVEFSSYSDNNITIPKNIGELLPKSLQKLYWSPVPIVDNIMNVPDLIMFEGLIELGLSCDGFFVETTFPENIGDLLPTNLQKLEIRHCVVTAFPDLRMFGKLLELDFNDGTSVNIPVNLGELLPKNLQVLKFEDCEGTIFPNLSMLDKLVELDLSCSNEMTFNVNLGLGKVLPQSLEKFSCQNSFGVFPDLSSLNKLMELDLSRNYNMFVHNQIQKRLPMNLKKLNLGSCELRIFPNLSMLDKLEELRVDLRRHDHIDPEKVIEKLPLNRKWGMRKIDFFLHNSIYYS